MNKTERLILEGLKDIMEEMAIGETKTYLKIQEALNPKQNPLPFAKSLEEKSKKKDKLSGIHGKMNSQLHKDKKVVGK